MSKRTADKYITRENEDDISDSEPQGGPKLALAEVMAKRKILKPRGRLGRIGDSTGFNASQPTGSNMFGGLASQLSAPPSNDTKLRALNEQFVAKITAAHNQPNTVADFVEACAKYIEYFEEIKKGSGNGAAKPVEPAAPATTQFGMFGKPAPATSAPTTSVAESAAPKPAPLAPEAAPAVSESEKPNPFAFLKKKTEPAVPTSGFSFLNSASGQTKPFGGAAASTAPAPASLSFAPKAAPTNSAAPFAFKPADTTLAPNDAPVAEKPAPKASAEVVNISDLDESSDDEPEEKKSVEIKGPAFTLGTVPTKKKLAFLFNRPPKQKDDSDLDSEVELKGPTFSFTGKISDPVFKIQPNSTAPKATESAPASESKPEELAAPAKPTFSFGKPSTTELTQDATKPSFSFGTPSNGAKDATSSAPAPSFLFGQSSTPSTGFKFGANNDKKEPEATKPTGGFSFGSLASEQKDKPAFSWGTPTEKTDNEAPKPFSFGKPAPTGDSAASKPSFNFSKPASAESLEKPKEDDKTAASKPLFSFPTAKEGGDKPAFSFGSALSNPFGAKSGLGDKPAFLFSFNKPTGFGNTPAAPATNNEQTASTQAGDEEAVDGAELSATFDPVVKLTDKVETQTGEENEETTYTKRAKLLLFDKDNSELPYVNKGLGEVKVLKLAEGKGRIVLRAEGGLRVLLNTAVSPNISYSLMGNGNLVRVPTVDPLNPSSISTYIIKVKTAQDGEELLKAINALK